MQAAPRRGEVQEPADLKLHGVLLPPVHARAHHPLRGILDRPSDGLAALPPRLSPLPLPLPRHQGRQERLPEADDKRLGPAFFSGHEAA